MFSDPLGMEGKVALSYGSLLKNICSASNFEAIAPRALKWTIGKFNPQFAGYEQHDAQELLMFVLDEPRSYSPRRFINFGIGSVFYQFVA